MSLPHPTRLPLDRKPSDPQATSQPISSKARLPKTDLQQRGDKVPVPQGMSEIDTNERADSDIVVERDKIRYSLNNDRKEEKRMERFIQDFNWKMAGSPLERYLLQPAPEDSLPAGVLRTVIGTECDDDITDGQSNIRDDLDGGNETADSRVE